MNDPILEVRGLTKVFPARRSELRSQGRGAGELRAVDGVDFEIRRGETLSLVGESGCGKTTTGRALLRLLKPDAGVALYRSTPEAAPVDLLALGEKQLRPYRRELQMVFQDPFASLNPRMTVAAMLGEALAVHGLARGRQEGRIAELMEQVGLDPGMGARFPHEFSGGQRQRVGIARALAVEPKLIVCDEAVSALDVSIQAQVINLLKDLQRDLGLTYLFIAHDLSVVKVISDRVAVMQAGRIVEMGEVGQIFDSPRHPYTRELLSAIPVADPRGREERRRQRRQR